MTDTRRVLIAEDNDITRRTLVAILERRGWQATAVANGREAVEALGCVDFDLVLMDVQMPVLDGFDATRAIRSLAAPLNAIPIIGVTALVYPEDLAQCQNAGMDRHVGKPVDFKVLFDEMEELLVEKACGAGDGAGIEEALANLMEATGGSREMVAELIADFLCCYRDRLDQMSGAIEAGNAQELERNAHRFKGSLGLFCRYKPLELTDRLMEMGAQGSLGAAPRTLELLELELELLVARLLEFSTGCRG